MTDETRQYEQAARALRDVPDLGDAALEHAERRIVAAVEANVRAAARRSRRSGRLDRSITSQVKGSGATAVGRVIAGAPHAHLVAGGTRPHRIAAVRSRALPIRRGGSAVGFADSVKHPGTRPRPFFAEGVEASATDIARILESAGDAILDDLQHSIRRR